MNITKEQYEELMEKLADKTLRKGVEARCKYDNYPIWLVGDEDYGDGFRYYCPSSGEVREYTEAEVTEIIGNQVLIGDVLFRREITDEYKETGDRGTIIDIWSLWSEFQNKSIQTIADESGWELLCCGTEKDLIKEDGLSICPDCRRVSQEGLPMIPDSYLPRLKSPEANALLSYLYKLFINTSNKK